MVGISAKATCPRFPFPKDMNQAWQNDLDLNDCMNAIAVNSSSAGTVFFQKRSVNSFQPAFGAYNATTDSAVTGDGTRITVDFNQEEFDNASNYSASTFTAPIGGRYLFDIGVDFKNSTGNITCSMFLVTSTATYVVERSSCAFRDSLSLSKMVNLSSSQTARVDLICSGGTKVIDVLGSNSTLNGSGQPTFFSGILSN